MAPSTLTSRQADELCVPVEPATWRLVAHPPHVLSLPSKVRRRMEELRSRPLQAQVHHCLSCRQQPAQRGDGLAGRAWSRRGHVRSGNGQEVRDSAREEVDEHCTTTKKGPSVCLPVCLLVSCLNPAFTAALVILHQSIETNDAVPWPDS